MLGNVISKYCPHITCVPKSLFLHTPQLGIVTLLILQAPSKTLYFYVFISLQKSCSSLPNLHNHLPNSALLKILSYLTWHGYLNAVLHQFQWHKLVYRFVQNIKTSGLVIWLFQNLRNNLALWKMQYLSRGGILTLVNCLLYGIQRPVYSFFPSITISSVSRIFSWSK